MEKPVTISTMDPFELKPVMNLAEVGITNPLALSRADAVIQQAIRSGAFPGCRVLAAKDGKIFYDKSFGAQTYGSGSQPVTAQTVYDLASLTKVVSTTMAVMRLYEQGKLDLDKSLGSYLPMTVGTNKAGIRIRDLLLHQAGLKSWIPFYRSFIDSTGQLMDTAFRSRPGGLYTIEVAQNLYLRRDYRDSVWNIILKSPLENAGRMVYSDLDFYFLAAVVEQITGRTIDRYVSQEFYVPMGLKTMGYNPAQFVKRDNIAPTENDLTFRRQTLQGYVHDPGAALFGGVAGHAGVFGTALDVAALFQMLLNSGTYRGRQYFRKETVRAFTAYGSAISRRGLGFDKPSAEKYDGGPSGNRSSGYTFGHQGFTGTCAWADPENGIVYVFLSNRVFPDQDNNLISKLGIRTVVQDTIYSALGIANDTSRPTVRKAQLAARFE
jgi:CubicO group peptidase (beta-lactamase class C family)